MIIQLNLSFQIDNTILLSNKEKARTKGRKKLWKIQLSFFLQFFWGDPPQLRFKSDRKLELPSLTEEPSGNIK